MLRAKTLISRMAKRAMQASASHVLSRLVGDRALQNNIAFKGSREMGFSQGRAFCSSTNTSSPPSTQAQPQQQPQQASQSTFETEHITVLMQTFGKAGSESTKSFSKSEPRFNSRSGSLLKRPLRPSVNCKQHVNPICSNSSMVPQRKFASKSKDDEDIYDDVEARLIKDDGNNREGMYMATDSAYGMASANFDDYGEENIYGEESSWAKYEKNMGASTEDEDEESDEGSDEESGSAIDPSDEEFEGERTDEELDELLENTPLFEPPDLEGPEEDDVEFSFRPEGPVYYPGMEYEPEELDITRPLPRRRREPRPKEVITVQEVIDKADFRNVRYLTKFITETGNIIARKEFDMRNKSHGRITKAIKTARFFGLMPYSNMGRPKYVFDEPFDEFAEFYETDDDERKAQDLQEGINYEGRASNGPGQFPMRRGGFNGERFGRRYS